MKTKVSMGSLWAVVKVERGFVSEVKLYRSCESAQRIQRRWKANLNPAYDEAAVVKAIQPRRT